jgi:hypothetical protein
MRARHLLGAFAPPHSAAGPQRLPQLLNRRAARSLQTLLTGMQCFLLTSGLTRRWLAYYSLPSTLLRLLSLQSICWPATSLTLKLVGPSRPLIGWVLIGTTTSLSNTIRIWVTSNIATFPRSAGGGGNGRAHRGTLREALSVANEDIRYASRSLLSIVIGGNGDVADDWDGNAASTAGGGGATGGNGTARAGKTLNKGVVRTKRRMDWRSVIRQVVWPCLTGYWLTAWFLVRSISASRCFPHAAWHADDDDLAFARFAAARAGCFPPDGR